MKRLWRSLTHIAARCNVVQFLCTFTQIIAVLQTFKPKGPPLNYLQPLNKSRYCTERDQKKKKANYGDDKIARELRRTCLAHFWVWPHGYSEDVMAPSQIYKWVPRNEYDDTKQKYSQRFIRDIIWSILFMCGTSTTEMSFASRGLLNQKVGNVFFFLLLLLLFVGTSAFERLHAEELRSRHSHMMHLSHLEAVTSGAAPVLKERIRGLTWLPHIHRGNFFQPKLDLSQFASLLRFAGTGRMSRCLCCGYDFTTAVCKEDEDIDKRKTIKTGRKQKKVVSLSHTKWSLSQHRRAFILSTYLVNIASQSCCASQRST